MVNGLTEGLTEKRKVVGVETQRKWTVGKVKRHLDKSLEEEKEFGISEDALFRKSGGAAAPLWREMEEFTCFKQCR